MKLSDQALTCIMMALQKSLMEQSDIVPVLKGFNLSLEEDGSLVIDNPPSQISVSKGSIAEDF